jgi:hypothetical protein
VPLDARGTIGSAPATKEATVTTSLPEQGQPETDDPRRVRAWRIYRESIRDLEGQEYEAAEGRAWERLQRMLGEIERAGHVDLHV